MYGTNSISLKPLECKIENRSFSSNETSSENSSDSMYDSDSEDRRKKSCSEYYKDTNRHVEGEDEYEEEDDR